ncbi:MAG: SH3 domain-containing protein [Anaerolineales bacterium]|nr:SH3 domain-containing protein [Anaerolineales bacterium]MCB9127832.1 SH3 domain-containing protein [Ardenticatenales bacterium]MCB9172899.1 SH3 domain-containing protein [Ardenticatenales bacterium]
MLQSRDFLSRLLVIFALLASIIIGLLMGGGLQDIRRLLSPFNRNVVPVTAVAATPTVTLSPTVEPSFTVTKEPAPPSTLTPTPRAATPTATATPAPEAVESPTAVPTAEPTVDSPTPTLQTVSGSVNIRNAPSFDAPIVAVLTVDDIVPVIGRSPDGALLKIVAGEVTGWITANANLVTITGNLDTVPVATE